MRCMVEGCEEEAAVVVDATNGSAFRLCSGHVPVNVTPLAAPPQSAEAKPGPAVLYMGGGMKN